jgi:DNA-binding transcriptional regulator YdaS (Cro superfamily)
MWQKYSQEVNCSNPAELDFKVGRRAFEAGVSQKQIALMLAAGSPTVKQMVKGQRKVQATKYVNRVAQLSCRERQQQVRLKAVPKRQIELGD